VTRATCLCTADLFVATCGAQPAPVPPPGQDLRLSYRSEIDGTDQPCRLYVPTANRTHPVATAPEALDHTGVEARVEGRVVRIGAR
jgi:hypothetical protein